MVVSVSPNWLADEPSSLPIVARVVATRLGDGGVAGLIDRPRERRKFVIDFEGGQLEGLTKTGSRAGNDDYLAG